MLGDCVELNMSDYDLKFFARKSNWELRVQNWEQFESKQVNPGFYMMFANSVLFENKRINKQADENYRAFLKYKGRVVIDGRTFILFNEVDRNTRKEIDKTALNGRFKFYTVFCVDLGTNTIYQVLEKIVDYNPLDFELILGDGKEPVQVKEQKRVREVVEVKQTKPIQLALFG